MISFGLLLIIVGVALTNELSIRDQIVNSLFEKYDVKVRPSEYTQNETVVTVYISISAITSVDVMNMQYTVDMLLRQEWRDPRLAWDHNPRYSNYTKNIVSPTFKTKIWIPDLFFRNGKEGRLHKITCENLLIRIQPNGDVLYSQKITMRLACQMHLRTFPMDTQECDMDIGSYGYTLEQLRFVWRNETPVTLPRDLQISEFDPPEEMIPHDCSSLYKTTTGQYTCLNVTFLLSRQIGYWLASTYIPNTLIMVVSWLNFWVSPEAVPARVNLSLLTLLGVITQTTSYASTLPRVSYIKAIDVWTIACIAFNSGVLLEFAFASHLSKQRKISEWQAEVRKMVRRELASWCNTCQQSYDQNEPSSICHIISEPGKPSSFIVPNSRVSEPSSKMLVRMTSSGLSSASSMKEYNSNSLFYKSRRAGKQPEQRWMEREHFASRTTAVGFESSTPAKDALLPVSEILEPAGPKRGEINEIDMYSRFIFPAGFIIYNCIYWVYYLVLMKHN
ncbi:Glycine receptor subunit beta [Clonorchis sinensis]|uniref:Glycine receptor subunit beta n=2 Tax=Clonorchis sinensis TaxID=79923 RepID=H2KSV9_CLOSI|nr:Glycine receptor subunit beta [Clonorchis sinensis]GAA36399.1 glycine receptor subunit beta [Clonorchis sinensis]